MAAGPDDRVGGGPRDRAGGFGDEAEVSSARWQRTFELFEGALEREGVERERYLDAACSGDAALRRELEALIAAHADAGTLLDRPVAALPRDDEIRPDAMIGSELGPYRIVRVLGEGGMGTVYEAEQQAPLQRRVALKLIKLGMDTREVMARFAVERRTLALMAHPAIAAVHDAGATPEGRPYFVMELVDGEPIDAYCDARRLGVRERLALFLAVCAGVEHAHRRGVLHRDLKPSNILVSEREGQPLPKIIDFGIAKAIGAEGDGTLGTHLGLLAGTPEYMSPEQASLGGDVDTRTDVYSLGVLLHELLAGVLPFDDEGAGEGGLLERLRLLRERDPPPLGRRLAAVADPEEVARRRGVDAKALRRELAGELEWIVARAVARQRDERYASVADLAAEVRRQLRGEAVQAGPPGRLYRLRKLVARHRGEAAAAALVLLALAGFGAVMAVQSGRLARALGTAEREATTARRTSDFLVHLLEQSDPRLARGEEVTVREVLDAGAADLAKDLATEPEVRAALLQTMGRVYSNLGRLDEAKRQLEQALRLRDELGDDDPRVATVLQWLGEVEFARGEYAAAHRLADRALAVQSRLLEPGDPAVGETLDLLGLLARQSGDFAAAAGLAERAIALKSAARGARDPSVATSWNLLGIARRRQGDHAGAEAAYRHALAIWRERLGATHPDALAGLNNLALVLHVSGKHGEARRLFDELIPLRRRLLGEDNPELLISQANLAKLLYDMRDLDGAERAYREAIAASRRSHGPLPQLAEMLADYGSLLGEGLGRHAEALAVGQEALRIRLKLYGDGHYQVAASRYKLARIHEARGDTGTAEALFVTAARQYRAALGDHPSTAEALIGQAGFLADTGRPAAGEPLLREAVRILRAKVPAGDRRLAAAQSALGECLTRLGRFGEAEALLVESLAVLDDAETAETGEARARLAALHAASGRAGLAPAAQPGIAQAAPPPTP
jgi:serine/threonine protein kinase/Tfp pilus assembly protein PilF